MVRYTRAVAKISGRAFAGPEDWAKDPGSLAHLAEEILAVHQGGTQIAAVIGGVTTSGARACPGDITSGALQALWEAGRRVPDDVALIGFEDSPIARHANRR
jgi:uridylate kinase